MDLSRARVVLRKRTRLDVLDLTLRFIVAHAGTYARVTAAAILPAALVSWAVAWKAGWVWGWIATVSLALLVQAPFTVLASRLVFEPEVGLREVLGASLRTLPRIFVLRIVQLFLMAAGLFFLVVPGVWLGASLLFVVEAAVLERASIGAAMSRSLKLSGGHFGYALIMAGLLLTLHVLATLLGDFVGRAVVGDLLQFQEPEPLLSAGGSPLALVGFWLFVPYVATARFFAYLDLRTRREGWDIQTRFAAIALRAQETMKRAA
jgi:hypothetical protein